MSKFLGGGFTSRLMRELRVKRGLTYSVGSIVSGQRDYGRALVSTFTKNKTLKDLLKVTKQTIDDAIAGKIDKEDFERARGGMAGGYPFKFESSAAHVDQLMILDHRGKSHEDFYAFPKEVMKIDYPKIQSAMNNIFAWDKQTIVVVGDKSLKTQLDNFGKVELVDYKDYL